MTDSVACAVCRGGAVAAGRKRGFDLYRCSDCGHLFVWPNPLDHLKIYSDQYFSGAEGGFGYTDYDADKRPMEPTFREYLRRIEEVTGKIGTLLDVGAATGFFLDLARQRGWKTCGVEPSEYAAERARAKGLDVCTGTLANCDLRAATFDVVTMWDVIEHVPDPRGALLDVSRVLKPKGVLAINTPDSGSFIARVLKTNWHLVVPPEHLNLFNRSSLRLLLGEQDFEVLQATTIGKKFTLQYAVQTLAHALKLRPLESAALALRRRGVGLWGIPINLHDNVFVLARRM